MPAFTLTLVLTASVMHASWNLLAKRAGGGVAFIWLTFVLSFGWYLPVVAVASAITHPQLTPLDWLFIAGNGVTHVAYFTLLARGYRSGELSLVYPLARGTGPLISSLAAIALFGERPTGFGLVGLGLIVAGIFIGSSGGAPPAPGTPSSPVGRLTPAGARRLRLSIVYGVATGASIAVYTLWDKYSVSTLAITPIVYDFWGNAVRTLVMTPFVIGRRSEIIDAWRRLRGEALGIAILSPLAYLLVLWALITTPVSVVAPAREISIVIGTVLGVRFFHEQAGRRRVAGAALMFCGIVALAHG